MYVGLNCLKIFCLSLVSGVPHFFFRTTALDNWSDRNRYKKKKKKPRHKVHLWLRFEWAKTAYFVWRKIDRQSSHSVRSHGASQQMMKHIADNLPLTIFPGCTLLQALHTGENEAVALAPHAKHKATSRWPEQ